MRAVITSIDETTTDLCEWSLNRLGFRTYIVRSQKTTLYQKLVTLFDIQDIMDEDFIRVDADVVVNKNVLELIKKEELLWYQALTFDWFKQDVTHGGIQFIRKESFPIIKKHLHEAERMERPETYLSRLQEFHNPRVFGTYEKICGLHGYKQKDVERVKLTKFRRGQQDNYDWELAERLEEL